MKRVFTNNDLCHLFCQWPRREQEHARNSGESLRFEEAYRAVDDDPDKLEPISVLYSYRTPIATMGQNNGEIYALITTQSYSITTTTKHMVHRYDMPPEVRTFYVHNPLCRTSQDHARNIVAMIEEADELMLKASRARKYKDHHIAAAISRRREAHAYAEFFGIEGVELPDISEDMEASIERVKRQEQERKQREKDLAESRKTQEAALFEKWQNDDAYMVGCPLSYRQTSTQPARLRFIVRSDKGKHVKMLETSEGVRVSIKSAARALRAIDIVRKREEGKTVDISADELTIDKAYKVNQVRSDVVVIGCHRISWEDIERLRPQIEQAA